MKEIIKKTEKFLYMYLNEANERLPIDAKPIPVEEIKYRYEHSLRVANVGIKLAEREGANKRVVTLGCLLHDVGKYDCEKNIDHGRQSAKVARSFLETLNLTKKEIDDICYSIAVHVDGIAGYEYEDIIEAEIVTNADNIDRFSAYRIYQQMAWDYRNGSFPVNQEKDRILKRIERLQNLYDTFHLKTKSGDEWFKENVKFQIQFYKRYLKQLEITIVPGVDES
ncbi:HD domain-containing protein [Mycoplasmatota bacterium]|nr:HD domain-containing protein [Mycoplasmatota bacterium]